MPIIKNNGQSKRVRPPARTPEARENQLIAAAVDLAEKQIREGTASSQVITHFLKLASPRERLEKEKLQRENELLKVKADAVKSAKNVEKLYGDALNAMKRYSGQGGSDEDY
jgi:uncharacterized protein YcaQ